MNAPAARRSFDSEGVQFAFDATSLALAEECQRKYYYKIIERWEPIYRSVHLEFGAWYAEALEHYYKYIALGADPEEALLKVVHEALINTWHHKRDENGERIPGTGGPWLSDHNIKTRENLIRTIVWYVEEFSGEPLEVVTLSNGKPAVEYSFTLDVDNGVVFCGHIDRLVYWNDQYYCMDQKTTGTTITPQFFRQFDIDTQMSMYAFAGKIIYNMPISGVIIDAAQIAVGFSRFERNFTHRTKGQLDEWYDDTLQLIADTQRNTREQRFRMNPKSCNNYGGCEFRDVCSRDPSVRLNFLKAKFVQGAGWDPIERR